MARFGNRVKETFTTTGTGDLDLDGAPTGFQAFADVFTDSDDEVSYLAVDDPDNPTEWEVGKGTFNAGDPNSFSRDTVEQSTNSGNKVSWQAGTKTLIALPTAADFEAIFGSGSWGTKSALVVAITGNTTQIAAHNGKTIDVDGSGNSPAGATYTLLPASTAGNGFVCHVKRSGAAGTARIAADGADTIDGAASLSLTSQYEAAVLVCDGTEWHVLARNVPAGRVPRSYLSGLGTSHGSDSEHDIDIAPGIARSAQNDADLEVVAPLTIAIDASGEDGLDTGVVANNTGYHIHLYRKPSDGSVHGVFSTSADSPALPDSAVSSRRIGWIRTNGSANILGYSQEGDEFLWDDPPLDYNTAVTADVAVTPTLSVPGGVRVWARVNAYTGGNNLAYASSPDTNSESASATSAPLFSFRGYSGADGGADLAPVRTDTSSRIRYVQNGSGNAKIATTGWIDRRGRDA